MRFKRIIAGRRYNGGARTILAPVRPVGPDRGRRKALWMRPARAVQVKAGKCCVVCSASLDGFHKNTKTCSPSCRQLHFRDTRRRYYRKNSERIIIGTNARQKRLRLGKHLSLADKRFCLNCGVNIGHLPLSFTLCSDTCRSIRKYENVRRHNHKSRDERRKARVCIVCAISLADKTLNTKTCSISCRQIHNRNTQRKWVKDNIEYIQKEKQRRKLQTKKERRRNYIKYKERYCEYSRQYRITHLHEVVERSKRWRQNNKEKIRVNRANLRAKKNAIIKLFDEIDKPATTRSDKEILDKILQRERYKRWRDRLPIERINGRNKKQREVYKIKKDEIRTRRRKLEAKKTAAMRAIDALLDNQKET